MTNKLQKSKIGTTFSQLQCDALGIDYQEVFKEVLKLNFDALRLCAYWSEIEPEEGKYDYTRLDWLLNEAAKFPKTKIVLALGMKVPRWPEFHFPDWVNQSFPTNFPGKPVDSNKELAEKALNVVRKIAERYKDNNQIQIWQIENECLTVLAKGFDRYLSLDFLKQEVSLVKKTFGDQNKILITHSVYLWPPFNNTDDKAFQLSFDLGDAHGFNVYMKVPLPRKLYMSPSPFYWRKLQKWQKQIKEAGKMPWITELQAEPWEYGNSIHTSKANFPSANPQRTEETVKKLLEMGFETILLWGCEYWYWSKLQGRDEWWKMTANLTKDNYN